MIGLFMSTGHSNELLEQVETDELSPQLSVNLISTLDAYLTEEVSPKKPFLIKDGIKIIL